MSLFHAHKMPLNFVLGGRRYVVPLGAEFEVDKRVAHAIKARGIPAAAGPAPEGATRVESVPEPRRVVPLLEAVSARDVDADLAEVNGDDDLDEDADDEGGDDTAAERTVAKLEAQGIRVPGKRPGRKKSN